MKKLLPENGVSVLSDVTHTHTHTGKSSLIAKCRFALFILFSFQCFEAVSQNLLIFDTTNQVISRKAYLIDNIGKALYFKCDSVNQGDLFDYYKDYIGLTPNDQMIETESWTSQTTDMIHVSYQQYRHGIFVEKSVFTEHIYEGSVVFTSGAIVEDLPINYVPTINETNAIEIAKTQLFDEKEVIVIDSFLIQDGDDLITVYDTITYLRNTSFPWEYDSIPYNVDGWDTILPHEYSTSPKLVYAYIPDYENDTASYVLCYRIELPLVSTDSILNYYWVYVDAHTGFVYKEHDDMRGAGTFNHIHYGNQQLDHAWIGGFYWRYILKANNGDRNIRTREGFASWQIGEWNNHRLPDNGNNTDWGTNHQFGTSAHFSVSRSFDYFNTVHGWRGFKGWGNDLIKVIGRADNHEKFGRFGSFVSWDERINLAWNLDGSIFMGVIDVAAHEFTHGIAKYRTTNDLSTTGDELAIEESFCDIFGLNANRWARPNNWSWRLGDEAQNHFIRDMSAPWNGVLARSGFVQPNTAPCFYPTQYPSTFQERYTGPCNEVRTYFNMNIMNYWYFLLEQGGTQLNVTVTGIGTSKARSIAWLTLHSYSRGEPDFQEIRTRTQQATIELFGNCSAELFEVCKAWDAVGVPGMCPCIQIGPPPPPCWDIINNNPIPAETFQGNVKEKSLQNKIQIYPNPAENILYIEFGNQPEFFEVNVTDLTGKKILSQKNNQVIGVANFTSGIYFVEILMPEGKQVHKLIKN